MDKIRTELTPDEKRAERFERWLSPPGFEFSSPEAAQGYKDRVAFTQRSSVIGNPLVVCGIHFPQCAFVQTQGYFHHIGVRLHKGAIEARLVLLRSGHVDKDRQEQIFCLSSNQSDVTVCNLDRITGFRRHGFDTHARYGAVGWRGQDQPEPKLVKKVGPQYGRVQRIERPLHAHRWTSVNLW